MIRSPEFHKDIVSNSTNPPAHKLVYTAYLTTNTWTQNEDKQARSLPKLWQQLACDARFRAKKRETGTFGYRASNSQNEA